MRYICVYCGIEVFEDQWGDRLCWSDAEGLESCLANDWADGNPTHEGVPDIEWEEK